MKFFKINKGEYNYIRKRRLYEIIKTVILFAFAAGLYLLGYLTLHTNKSLWSVFAVLSVLPAAKSAVSMIMFLRFSSIKRDEFEAAEAAGGNVNTLYELIFTTRDRAFFVPMLSCTGSTIIALFDTAKEKNKDASIKELKEHIASTLKRGSINSCSIKIYTKQEDYLKRLGEMNEKLMPDDTYIPVFNVIKSVTL